MTFKNRESAGRLLAEKLKAMNIDQPVVYGIPRGGLVCAREIAQMLNAPLSAIVVRKIGHPDNPELAIGAVAEDGDIELASDSEYVDQKWLKKKIEAKQAEARKRREYIMAGGYPLSVENKTAILVDDGLATGFTILLALKEINHLKPKRIIIAVPVSHPDIAEQLKKQNYELVILQIPRIFLGAIGAYYDSFDQVSDEEARRIIGEARKG